MKYREHHHTHDPDHDHLHDHDHEHGHSHGHGPGRHIHTPEENKKVLDRLARAIGHLESVRTMVADGRDCADVLVQLSAVRSALNKTGLLILQNHLEHCVVEAARDGDMTVIADLNKAIGQYFK